MSHVDNVILSFSILEKSTAGANGERWPLMDQINAWLVERNGQHFGPDLGSRPDAYGGRKALETPLFVGAFSYMPEVDFLAFLRALPWEQPDEVQYIVKRQHEDLFQIMRL